MAEKFQALKKAREEDGLLPDGFWGASQPKCPHCGEVCDISDNDWYRLYEEGEHEVDCPHCDGEFTVGTRVSFSFDTCDQEAMADEDGDEAAQGKEASNG